MPTRPRAAALAVAPPPRPAVAWLAAGALVGATASLLAAIGGDAALAGLALAMAVVALGAAAG